MNWAVQCAEYYLYRGVSRTNAYELCNNRGYLSVVNRGETDTGTNQPPPVYASRRASSSHLRISFMAPCRSGSNRTACQRR